MLLDVHNLNVTFVDAGGAIRAVRDASFSVGEREIVGIVGESGSGKSSLCAALNRSLPSNAHVTGDVRLAGRSLYALSAAQMNKVRGREIGMILQNPMTSLDPLFTIGNQLDEVLAERRRGAQATEWPSALDLLLRVHIADAGERLRQFPHQLSGGMKQRVLTAMAMAGHPKLLIADEPTTALDVTIQEEVLVLFKEIRDNSGSAILIVTHDLEVVRRVSDRVIVMYAGRIVEAGPTDQVFAAPRHPYTSGLLASVPRVKDGTVVLSTIPGQVPKLDALGTGCAFADRCALAFDVCRARTPDEFAVSPVHRAFCWRVGEPAVKIAVDRA